MSQSDEPAKRSLIGVAQAQSAMIAAIHLLTAEAVELDDALDRVLAQDVVAMRDQPPFDVSSMDGYALRCADTPGNVRLAGESAAGHGFVGRLEEGTAIRISTGAPVPDGADGVAIQEDVNRDGQQLRVPQTGQGQHIRHRGADFRAGSKLLARGRRLDSAALSLAAASGSAQVLVTRKPRVCILCSGDELAAPGTVPGPWQIFDSTSHAIAAQVRKWGGIAKHLPMTKDDVCALAQAAQQGLDDSDLLVVIGGASVGDHDHARPALMRLGLKLLVDKVAVRPGKPTWFGTCSRASVLGLPGNPASAQVCAELFLRPLLAAMQGLDAPSRIVRASLVQSLPANGPREHYLRSRLDLGQDGRLTVRAFPDQDSSLISVLAAANALIRLAAGTPAMPEGSLVDVLLLDDRLC